MERTGPARVAPAATEQRRHDPTDGIGSVTTFGETERMRPSEALGLYTGNANRALAAKIGRYLGTELGLSLIHI